MEELRMKLEQIKHDIEEIDHATDMLKKENGILEMFDRVNKEVI